MRTVRNYLIFTFLLASSAIQGAQFSDMHYALIGDRVDEIPLMPLQLERHPLQYTNEELEATSADRETKLNLSPVDDLSRVDLTRMRGLKSLGLVRLDVGNIKGLEALSNLTTLTVDACYSQEFSVSYLFWALTPRTFDKKGSSSTPPLQFAFPKWESLTHLILSRLKGGVDGLGELRNLRELSVLDCPDLQFSLSNLQHLERLTLKSIDMNHIVRPHPLESLSFLSLEDTANLSERFFENIGPVTGLVLKFVNVNTLRWLHHLPKLTRLEVINLQGELTASQKNLLFNFRLRFDLGSAYLEKQFECTMLTHIFTNPSIFGTLIGSFVS